MVLNHLRDDPKKVNNVAKDTKPGVADDIDSGFIVGSKWFYTTTGETFICKSSARGAAVWVPALFGVKAYGFTGSNGTPNHSTLTGALVGQKVIAIWEVTGATLDASALFEAIITVADQIQQASNTNLSAAKYVVLLG